ncbi:MAG: PKD domain-containing protein, partial [Planctomycetota bacterium]
YIIELIVTDSLGAQSTAAQVVIDTYNAAPTADAGPVQTVHPRDVVTLDGSASSDPESDDPLSYLWQFSSKPQASTAELSGADTVSPSFTVDALGDYIIELIVTDSLGAQSTAAQVVIGTYNAAPTADAGLDQTIIVIGITVELDGRQSSDPEGDGITYLWTITHKPAGSAAELTNQNSATPAFTADIHGDYSITLVVTDVFGAVSTLDSMMVVFENIEPVADAGVEQTVIVGDTVYLDGSTSADGNGDLLTYSWSFSSKPEQSLAELTNPASVQTSFAADEPGVYVLSLVVNDGFAGSDTANVIITAITYQEAAVRLLLEATDVVNSLDPEVLKNGNVTRDSLINKIEAALGIIGQGNYKTAVGKLQNDIIEHTNGCANSGQPDSNDWILACDGQGQIYPLITEAIEHLQNLI